MRIGGGEAGGRRLRHHLKHLRPTSERVRLALFSMLGPDGATGKRVLDLYAGTGAFGLEALSRGAAWAEFVERDERACEVIRRSIEEFGFKERSKVHRGQAQAVAERLEGPFDIVFADPPYEENPFARLFETLALRGTLAGSALVIAEHSKRRNLPEALEWLRQVSRRTYGDSAVTVYRFVGNEKSE
ncbi:MAG: 16S rRNA (guanine(966)-N(2))-methyltransferase RsmD [Chloroflexi bacterium]|nr:16S rRNA (guanine(966)-N(2))-methyltransferase RsmD [Chloroflexota bacterium]